jgi:hypothetical protein
MLPALLKKFIKHCGAAIESLIIETGCIAYFYLATAKMIDKSLFRHSTCHRQEAKPAQTPLITGISSFTVRFLTHLPR